MAAAAWRSFPSDATANSNRPVQCLSDQWDLSKTRVPGAEGTSMGESEAVQGFSFWTWQLWGDVSVHLVISPQSPRGEVYCKVNLADTNAAVTHVVPAEDTLVAGIRALYCTQFDFNV